MFCIISHSRYWQYVKRILCGQLPRLRKKDYGSMRSSDENHHGCPLNELMRGVFFTGNSEQGMGYTIATSPFGDTRWMMPLGTFHPDKHKFYFADFYCNNTPKVHYVVIGITKDNTVEDIFCQRTMIPINPRDNHFFIFCEDGMGKCSNSVWVNFFYMKDMALGPHVLLDSPPDVLRQLYDKRLEHFIRVTRMVRVCSIFFFI